MTKLTIVPAGSKANEALLRLLEQNKHLDPTAAGQAIATAVALPQLDEQLRLFLSKDPRMLEVLRRVRILAPLSEPVLITGPSGTGKELIAKALACGHGGKFVPVNCGGLATNLVPSIFFGYRKGAFTGANEDRTGVLREASGGTVFLDEIGDFPLDLQATLLRAIQENAIIPVGATTQIKIDCRFIAATKYDLRQLVDEGKFREDLFARLYTYELHLTGLQERPDDIPYIAEKLGWPIGQELPDGAMKDIYRFNVRAIETMIARYNAFGVYE